VNHSHGIETTADKYGAMSRIRLRRGLRRLKRQGGGDKKGLWLLYVSLLLSCSTVVLSLQFVPRTMPKRVLCCYGIDIDAVSKEDDVFSLKHALIIYKHR
jgi:hypothetical protein